MGIKAVSLLLVSAKMIIVDMPWIMNGEPELTFPHYLTSHFQLFCVFVHSWHLKITVFQLRGRS